MCISYICDMIPQRAVHTNTKIKRKKTMEKNLLIQNLKSKAGVDNLSDRTFDEVAEALLPQFADDEKITEESWNIPVQMLKTMSGQLRHDVADGVNKGKNQWETEQKAAQQKAIDDAMAAFKAQWEKDHPNPNPNPNPNPEPPKDEKTLDEKIAEAIGKAMGGLTAEDGALGKITKQFTDYMARQEQEKKDAFINGIRENLKSYLLDERMADREPVVNLAIKELVIDEKSDFDKLKIEVEKKYESLYKDFYGDSGSGPYAGGAGGGTNTNKEFEEFIKQRKAEAEAAAKDTKELESQMM